jgi:predicted tellurium resistance membrane protein TerC
LFLRRRRGRLRDRLRRARRLGARSRPPTSRRILTFGILVAPFLRAIFIALGAALLAAFSAYIVFVANAFALLGLRALFFLVSGLLDRLVYLSTALSIILAFIGARLALHWGHLQDDSIPEIATGTSVAVIVAVLAVTTASDPEPVTAMPGLLRSLPPWP